MANATLRAAKENLVVPVLCAVWALVLGAFALWSWVLMDTNFTLINTPLWTTFRNWAIDIGYFHRPLSANIYVILIVALTLIHVLLVMYSKRVKMGILITCATFTTLLSYPALSHDVFNYIFDAKIATYYGKNPYLYKAQDFPGDPMVRFMHWTHRTYNYGPTFLPITLMPSLLSLGKFIAAFLLFKLMWIVFFIVAVRVIEKMNKEAAVFFATSPLVIVEGLINMHNDFIALALGVVALSYFGVGRQNHFYGFAALSGLIKYFTLPLILWGKAWWRQLIAVGGVAALVAYVSFTGEVQPWYFLNMLVFIAPLYTYIKKLSVLFFALLLAYYPYVRYGEWGTQEGQLGLKHAIILTGLGVTALLFIATLLKKIKKPAP